MLTIRLTRKGKKNQPFFRVVLIDKRRSSKGGRAVEDLGYVDPLKKRKSFNKERILYWISKGAQPSASIHNFLVSEKIIEGKKTHVSKISKKKQTEIDAKKNEEKAKIEAEAKAKEDVKKVEPAGETPSNDGAATEEAPVEIPVESPAEPAPVEEPKEPASAEASASVETSAGQADEAKPAE
jgi:small subunit ribosomal protein S16